ncbi:DNA polymerase IV [Acidithiobacillus thiooxidans]|uniref:DNA polymerase IV n=1 Tax=Acidithiobacillus thiooxidans ATCC 19377 TaxID=637390 RepID=A0A543PYI1_ACITH|nr:DNA polymerase IV [Acidithiobacillus thiooxidans]MDX5935727.1 DNA polymerase IV [Acidithiobacillus thiooxidans]TQN49126.1 DNA polymerase IV [Acidithiobacillus thiooxidans ATCC 19377]
MPNLLTEPITKIRKIIHVDMDAFFAAVEQRDHPELQGQPVIVGGDPAGRGVVATCSYEARRFGIHSAMTAARARSLCPQAIFLRPRMEAYRKASRQVMNILRRYTPLVEPLSLDEAFLDVTVATADGILAVQIAREIRWCIQQETGLIASAGVSYNKLLAKLASDWRKPNGLFVIPPEKGLDFLSPLPVGKLHGVGPATVKKLSTLGIHTVLDLRNAERETLIAQFGKTGLWFYEIARGIDKRPVQPSRQRKSVGAERTFPQNINDPQVMLAHLQEMASQVSARLITVGLAGRTISIKVRFSDFETITRAYTHAQAVWRKEDLIACLPDLLDKALPVESQPSIRLLGVSVSGMLRPEDSDKHTGQMDLLEEILVESRDVRR